MSDFIENICRELTTQSNAKDSFLDEYVITLNGVHITLGVERTRLSDIFIDTEYLSAKETAFIYEHIKKLNTAKFQQQKIEYAKSVENVLKQFGKEI